MARILVIDDEDNVRTMIRTALEVDKHEVQEASDAESGMDLFRKQPADLVITDIRLPGKGGLDVIKQLRQDHPDIRIIALSGKGAYDLKRARRAGRRYYHPQALEPLGVPRHGKETVGGRLLNEIRDAK